MWNCNHVSHCLECPLYQDLSGCLIGVKLNEGGERDQGKEGWVGSRQPGKQPEGVRFKRAEVKHLGSELANCQVPFLGREMLP